MRGKFGNDFALGNDLRHFLKRCSHEQAWFGVKHKNFNYETEKEWKINYKNVKREFQKIEMRQESVF